MAKTSKTKRKHPASQAQPPAAAVGLATRSPWTLPVPAAVLLGLGLVLAVLLILRWHFIDVPLERDESAYAYLGKRTLEGQIPYRDFYEMKPPLLFYGYAALIALFGYSATGLHWAALALTFWSAAWVMGIGARFFGLFYGFLAAMCYVLLAANPATTAMLAESEHLVMAFVLPGLYCCLRWEHGQRPSAGAHENTPGNRWWLFAGGFLLACGILVKQTGVFFLGIPALLLLIGFWQGKPRNFTRLIMNSLWFTGGAVVPVLAFAFLMSALGNWKECWFWNVEYLQIYSAGLNKDLWTTAFAYNFDLLTQKFGLYWFLGGAGLAALFAPALPGRYRLLLAGLALASLAAVAPGWRFYTHYWLQFLPALALLMAAFFYHLEKGSARLFPRANMRPLLAGLAAVLLLLPVAQNSAGLFKSDPDRLIRKLYAGNPFAEDKVLANLIAAKLKPDDQVAVLGSEPQYYVYLNRKAPSRHFYMAFTMRPIPQSEAWQQEALDSIIHEAPRFIVFNFVEYSWMPKKDSKLTLYKGSYKYTREQYHPIAWADMTSLTETKYVLNETEALSYQPGGQRYVTVYERNE